jgi:nitrous oxidase accessory protein
MFSNFDVYSYNVFTKNGAGVAVMFSKEIKMYHNQFISNWGGASYGLLLKEIYDADIRNNVFKDNTIGIRVEGSTRINYVSNEFISNGWALKIAGGCYDNFISLNNFISNSFDLAMDKSSNNNRIERNHWSEYSGYDLDKDGLGDVPHRPVKLFDYIVNQAPESIILLRSLFIDLINFSERVSPIFTPKDVVDDFPVMNEISNK